MVRFRQLSLAYGAGGISWWDWQEATGAGWQALSTADRLSGRVHAQRRARERSD